MKTQKIGVNLCHLWLVLFALIVTANGRAGENLNFARAFGSYMVLQQGQPVPVWGTAKPEAKVTIALGVQKQTAIANTDGRWKTVFPSLKAKGQTLQLTAETAAGKTTLDDILVGEVWLCAGQSNMEWKLSQSASAKTAIPTAKHAQLRLFNFVGAARGGSGDYTPELAKRLTPQRFCSGQWRECSPDSAAPFSAVGYFFGQKLLADLNVPVGLGRYSFTHYDYDSGYYFYERPKWVGAFWDKLAALQVLTDPEVAFLGVNAGEDIQGYALGYWLFFPDILSKIFGGIIADMAQFSDPDDGAVDRSQGVSDEGDVEIADGRVN